jgi:hypothetical protein
MARIGVSITKSTPFRDSVQEFSNVYYYECATVPNATQAESIIDSVVAVERGLHGAGVTFVRGRCWTETGNKATNEMITQKTLSGTGNLPANTTLDKERALLFRLRAGNDSRGNPVYLRKWYHPQSLTFGGVGISSSHIANTGGFTTTERNGMVSVVAAVENANGNSFGVQLVAKSGRTKTSGAQWEAHKYLEHHQLGDQWRAQ